MTEESASERGAEGAPDDTRAGDETIVVSPRYARQPDALEGDETVVVARRAAPGSGTDARTPADDAEAEATVVVARRDPPAPPLPDPPTPADPVVHAVYSARSATRRIGQGLDAVHAAIGAPPAAPPVLEDVPARGPLPSVVRRSRRRRVITLVGYAGAIAVSIAGLAVIVNMAFGGR